jgi:hypothetical protein
MDPSSALQRLCWFPPTLLACMRLLITPYVGQGAPHSILAMCHNKDEIKAQVEAAVLRHPFPCALVISLNPSCRQVHECGTRGIRTLAIARQDNEDGRWRFLGILTFLDPPHQDTKHTLEFAKMVGLEVRQ